MNNSTPRVTVVMPSFEHSHFIRRALSSLLAQSMEDWECVIVDDGSADDTARVVAPCLQDRRFAYVRLAHNTGSGNAINEGLARHPQAVLAFSSMQALRARVRQERPRFTFDHHVPALEAFFHALIAGAKAGRGRQA